MKRKLRKEHTLAFAGRLLILVENRPVPFDRRVWQEANSLKKAGYEVTAVFQKRKGYSTSFEAINEIYIYHHPLPFETRRAAWCLVEYLCALFWQFISQ